MLTVNCPRCKKEFNIDVFDGKEFIIIPIFKKCEYGEKYSILDNSDDEHNVELIADFFEYINILK